jgi:hypothetical protein
MALTRAQLLMGNDGQGAVLPGEVQAVKQGAGIFIDTDGTISVDASSVVGLVKLNSGSAFNGYVWPNTKGAQNQVLTMGAGNSLVWSNGGVFVSGSAPLNPEIGDLWFDCTTGQLLVYEACTTGAPKWTSGSEGLPALPGNTTASPAFASRSGTLADPYICTASSASTGGAVFINRVTVSDLAPFQFVPIIDLNAVVNGGRFTFSNNVADASGILQFDIIFTDSPASPIGATYTCAVKIGYGSVYIDATVSLTDVLVISSPGTISGSGIIGSPLTYATGTAAGGVAPYSYTWTWNLFSDGSVLQTGGQFYTPSLAEFGDSVYVTLTAEDNEGQLATASTSDFGPISKPPFPNPTPPTIPTTVGVESCFIWNGSGTTLQSDRCLLFKVGAGAYSQGPTPVTIGQTVCTKWSTSAPGTCGNANSGTYIEGCLFDATYSTCSALTVDRIPDPLTFIADSVEPGAVATSFPVTVTGNNAPAFITLGPNSDGSNFSASTDGVNFSPVPAAGTYTLSVRAGQMLTLRFTAGNAPLTDYQMEIHLGDSTGFTSAIYEVTTTNADFPTTNISFPTATSGPNAIATSVAWGNGTTFINATGCIEFSVDNGNNWTQNSTQIIDGVQLKTRWISSSPCAGSAQDVEILGTITNGTYEETGAITINRVPSTFPTFGDLPDESPSTQYLSNSVTPSGYNSTGYVTLAAGATLTTVEAAVGGGSFAPIPSSGTTMPINPGQTLQIRATTGSSYSSTYSATVQIGTGSTLITDTWSITTGMAVPSVDTPNIVLPATGTSGVGTATGFTYLSSPFASRDGAGTGHASSTWEVYSAAEIAVRTSAINNIATSPTYDTSSSRSIRFTPSNSSYFERAFTVAPTNRRKWTWSCWVKWTGGGGIFGGGDLAATQVNLAINGRKIIFTDLVSSVTKCELTTTDLFPTTIANAKNWFQIVLSVDTTQSAPANRVKLYVNGEQVTAFDTAVYYAQNELTTMNTAQSLAIGANGVLNARVNYFNGNLAQITSVDGEALPPTDFAQNSGGVWIPKAFTGSYGINGFQLLFTTQVSPSATTIGLDSSGNSNNFTPNNIATVPSTSFTFNTSGQVPGSIDALLVSGGSGGTGSFGCGAPSPGGSGGGGGAVVETTGYSITEGRYYPVVVGPGGGGGSNGCCTPASFGMPTTIPNRYSLAGGRSSGPGGSPQIFNQNVPCNPTPGATAGYPGTPGFGFPGATAGTVCFGGDPPCGTERQGPGGVGGGGAGAAGGASPGRTGGDGTVSTFDGTPTYYGGGGAGQGGDGGLGGGGGYTTPVVGYPQGFGAPNTGGGGAGAPNGPAGGQAGKSGGSGVIRLRYPTSPSYPITIGENLTASTTTSGLFTYTTFTATPGPNRSNNVPDSPVPGSQANPELGNTRSGNYNVMNPLFISVGGPSVTDGGLVVVNSGYIAGTIPIYSGKYYWEIRRIDAPFYQLTNPTVTFGVSNPVGAAAPGSTNSYMYNTVNGNAVTPQNPAITYGTTPYTGDVFGVAFNADTGEIYFSVNGVWQASGNPATGQNPAISGLTTYPYYASWQGAGGTWAFNFGQFPYQYSAPTGYGPLVENTTVTTLTFDDATGLSNMLATNRLAEVGGDASGIISSVNLTNKSVSLVYSQGSWTIGEIAEDLDVLLPAPAPTTEPPDPGIYTLVENVINSSTDKTSLLLGVPPADPFTTYYARVKYTSTAPTTISSFSSYNKVTTGSLT